MSSRHSHPTSFITSFLARHYVAFFSFVIFIFAAIIDIHSTLPKNNFIYLGIAFSVANFFAPQLRRKDSNGSIQLISVANRAVSGSAFQCQLSLSGDYLICRECYTSQYVIPLHQFISIQNEQPIISECNFNFSTFNISTSQIYLSKIKVSAFSEENVLLWHECFENKSSFITDSFLSNPLFSISIILFHHEKNAKIFKLQFYFSWENPSEKRVLCVINVAVLFDNTVNVPLLLGHTINITQ